MLVAGDLVEFNSTHLTLYAGVERVGAEFIGVGDVVVRPNRGDHALVIDVMGLAQSDGTFDWQTCRLRIDAGLEGWRRCIVGASFDGPHLVIVSKNRANDRKTVVG